MLAGPTGNSQGGCSSPGVFVVSDVVSESVEAISGQHGERLDMLLAVTGLNGQDPISDSEGSRRIRRSHVRVGQLRRRLFVLRDQARPPAGAWMPQVVEAERDGWPEEYTERGVDVETAFFGVVGTIWTCGARVIQALVHQRLVGQLFGPHTW